MIEDITYCMRFDCELTNCPRHYNNRRNKNINHSISDLEYGWYCIKTKPKKDKEKAVNYDGN